ncbi:MAG TPA: ABC transporter permease [Actinomycetota bacterium]|nr:ABC transporter permease [Actinomycetota bacterium]
MSSAAVSWGIAKRNLMLIPRMPSTFFPSLVMPVFLTISFAGAFSGIVELPGFPAEAALNWFIPMTTIQGAAFAGITTGMGMARDFESGFYDRFLASPAPRAALLGGSLLASTLRAVLPFALLMAVTVVSGTDVPGGLPGLLSLATAALGVGLVAGAWSVGVALRAQTLQAVPLIQSGMFLGFFLSTAQMPIELLTGWLHHVARFNPMTNVLQLARQGYLGDVTWTDTWPGLVSLTGMFVVLGLFARRGMRKAIP